ncbi:unnamed protein product [Ilex paraguariensis]|uniref:Uncharacterized protein n=1 Tax=Ilex paraguariensis TaxID=185542 RepID=A0ABC8S1T7_9AQUA
MARRLIPSLNRVLVEKIIPPSKTNAGILLPEKTTKFVVMVLVSFHNFELCFSYFTSSLMLSDEIMLNSGKVVAVGPGLRDREGKVIPVSVKEGDTVLLPEYGGTEVKLADKE